MRQDIADRLRARIRERQAQQLGRTLRAIDQVDGTLVQIDGRALRNFASNDYLGLAQSPEVTEALIVGARRWGVGAGAAHLLGGHREAHAQLEAEAAAWLGYERAMVFSTGYAANLAVIATLLDAGDLCVQDKLNHACLIDGAKLSGARLKRYRHADLHHAAAQFDDLPEGAALLASDAVFSMDGDIAPIRGLAALAKHHQAMLYLDDAHGIGVLGDEGRGSVAASGCTSADVPLLMITLGKAIGTSGALVLGSADMIDALVQMARPFVFSTATPPAVACATTTAIRIVRQDHERRARLSRWIHRFREAAMALGYALMPSSSAIQPLLVGSEAGALQLSKALESAGFYVPAIRWPTVPKGQARLRVTLSAAHTESDLSQLLDALARFRPVGPNA